MWIEKERSTGQGPAKRATGVFEVNKAKRKKIYWSGPGQKTSLEANCREINHQIWHQYQTIKGGIQGERLTLRGITTGMNGAWQLLGMAAGAHSHQIVMEISDASSIVCLDFPESGFAASIAEAQLQTKVAFGLGLYWFERFGCGMWLSIKSTPANAGIRRYNCQKEL